MTAPAYTTGYLTIGGWSSNAVEADGTVWWTEDLSGWDDEVAPRIEFTPHDGADGAFDSIGYDDVRVITLSGFCEAPDPVTRQAKIAAIRAAGRDLAAGIDVIGVMDDGSYLVHGKRSAEWPITKLNRTAFRYQMVITCADPRLYSADLNTVTVGLSNNVASGPGPFQFPASFPMGFIGPSAGAGQIATQNDGNADSWPVITFTGPTSGADATGLTLYDQATGRQLTITDLPPGQFVELDTRPGARGVLLMGTQPRRDLLGAGSQWFPIPAGVDLLTFSAPQYSTATVTVAYRDAW